MTDADGEDAVDLPLQIDKPTVVAPHSPRWRRLLRRGVYVPGLLGLVFLGGVLGMYFQPLGLKSFFGATGLAPGGGTESPIAVSPSAAAALQEQGDEADGADVVALGKLLPRGDVVVLAQPSGSGDARIEALHVEVGDHVERGATVATLDNLPGLQAAVDAARATVALREASVSQTQKSVGSSRAETKASLKRATAAADEARSDFTRTKALFDKGVVARADLDEASSRSSQAVSEAQRLKATLARFSSSKKKTPQSDVLVSMRSLESAKAELERAERALRKGQVTAPTAGTVLEIHARPGEKPGAAGVVELGNLDEMTAEVEVFQTHIGRVSVGDHVELVAEALPSRLIGSVDRIGLRVASQTLIESDPAANLDARVVKVIVRLDAPSSTIARTFTNLEVVARIRSTKNVE